MVHSKKVLELIEKGDCGWECMVPPEVAEVIKEKGYLSYKS